MKRIKIKNIIAIACAVFIVVCNLKYAHDGYGIRNAKPEERGYATTAKPTYRHEKYPYYLMCEAINVPIYATWIVYNDSVPSRQMEITETHFATCFRGPQIKKAVQSKVEELYGMGAISVEVDDFYFISYVHHPSYEYRCEPSGDLIDCQNETETCPMIS